MTKAAVVFVTLFSMFSVQVMAQGKQNKHARKVVVISFSENDTKSRGPASVEEKLSQEAAMRIEARAHVVASQEIPEI